MKSYEDFFLTPQADSNETSAIHIIQYGPTLEHALVLWPRENSVKDAVADPNVRIVDAGGRDAVCRIAASLENGMRKCFTILTTNRDMMPLTIIDKHVRRENIDGGLVADVAKRFLHINIESAIFRPATTSLSQKKQFPTLTLMRWSNCQDFYFMFDSDDHAVAPHGWFSGPSEDDDDIDVHIIYDEDDNAAADDNNVDIQNINKIVKTRTILIIASYPEEGQELDLRDDAHSAFLVYQKSTPDDPKEITTIRAHLRILSSPKIKQPTHAISLPASYFEINQKWPSPILPYGDYDPTQLLYYYCPHHQGYVTECLFDKDAGRCRSRRCPVDNNNSPSSLPTMFSTLWDAIVMTSANVISDLFGSINNINTYGLDDDDNFSSDSQQE